MRRTIRITGVLLALCAVAGLYAGVTISDVEYLTGEDFVQLHFKTGKMIPIPDLYYPESGNYTHIVMRIPEANPGEAQRNLQFDSVVIDSVTMKRDGKDTEVDIHLKMRVNYRVFTNSSGLFIEFPRPADPAAPVPAPVKAVERKSPPVARTAPPPAVPQDGEVLLKSFRIADRSPDSVRFAFQLSKEAKYKVIPIPDSPARLAIDLLNVKSHSLLRDVNHLNVLRLRGAVNRPGVFRLVFDLKAMQDYSVTYDKGNLMVAFFDTHRLPKPRPIIAKVQKAVAEKAKSTVTSPGTPDPQSQPPAEKKVNKPHIRLEINGDKVTGEPMARPSEFFSSEKSDVTPPPPTGNESPQTESAENASSQTQYLRNTIESGRKEYTGDPMDFIFKDADLKNVLKSIAGIVGLNLVMDPGVTGRVTSELIGVPWDQALEIFLKINGLDMVLEGNILRVGKVDSLAREAAKRRALKEAQEIEEDLEVFTRALSYAKASDVLKILNSQLSKRGSIMTDDRTNTLIISEVPNRIQLLDRLIDTLDGATPQVSIEARIIESNVNAQEAFGVQWGYNVVADSAYGNQTSLSFPNSIQLQGNEISNIQNPGMSNNPLGGYAINLPAQGRTSGTVFSFGNVANTFRLDMAISALQKKGKVKIISSPRTTTQNNMEAVITQGRQIPVQTIQNNTVTVRFQPAALELRVTPQITAKGDVICTLDIQNNSADFANTVNGIPPIITQATATTIRVPDGQTIAIGGLYRVENSVTREGVPLLSKIPILGSLFRNRSVSGDKRELLIFVTPRIIK